MATYEPEQFSREKSGTDLKQLTIAGITALLLTGLWWSMFQSSTEIITWLLPDADLSRTVFTDTILNSPYPVLALTLLVLTNASLLLASLVVGTLLISTFFIRLLPVILPPVILFAYLFFQINVPSELTLTAMVTAVIFFSHALFAFSTVIDLHLYKKFSLFRIISPQSGFLWFGISAVLSLPIYFYFLNHPAAIKQLINQKIITPSINLAIKTMDFSQGKATDQPDPIDQSESPLFDDLPEMTLGQIRHLLPEQVQENLASLPDDLEVNQPSEIQNQMEASLADPQSEIRQQLDDQLSTQLDKYLLPLAPYLPLIITASVMMIIFQILSFLKPLLIFPSWLVFKLLLYSNVARIIIQQEAVEEVEV